MNLLWIICVVTLYVLSFCLSSLFIMFLDEQKFLYFMETNLFFLFVIYIFKNYIKTSFSILRSLYSPLLYTKILQLYFLW